MDAPGDAICQFCRAAKPGAGTGSAGLPQHRQLYLSLVRGGPREAQWKAERQRADVAQQRHPGQDGHRHRCGRLAVLDEDLPGAERAADGGQAGRRQHGQQPVPHGDGPGHQQDRGPDQGQAEQRVHGQRQRGGGDLAEDPGVRVGGRDGDVEVQEDAQAVLEHQHDQRGHAHPAQPGPSRPARVPARSHEFVTTASHRTRSPFLSTAQSVRSHPLTRPPVPRRSAVSGNNPKITFRRARRPLRQVVLPAPVLGAMTLAREGRLPVRVGGDRVQDALAEFEGVVEAGDLQEVEERAAAGHERE